MHISTDGLIRLSIEELLSAPLCHLFSGVDEEARPGLDSCGRATSISGYTEWVSKTEPALSIGWDWGIQPAASGAFWTRLSLPRSNIIVIEETGTQPDWNRNLQLLATIADSLPWRERVPQAIASRYSWNPDDRRYPG